MPPPYAAGLRMVASVNRVKPFRGPLLSVLLVVTLVAAACGSESSTETSTSPAAPADTGATTSSESDTDAGSSPGAAAVTTIEVLDVVSGNATTIADTVTGDRPVLLWFWAPH